MEKGNDQMDRIFLSKISSQIEALNVFFLIANEEIPKEKVSVLKNLIKTGEKQRTNENEGCGRNKTNKYGFYSPRKNYRIQAFLERRLAEASVYRTGSIN